MKAINYSLEDFEKLKKIGIYSQFTYKRKLIDIAHSHTFYEIVYIYSGSCTHVINEHNDLFVQGEIVFIRPGDVHYFKDQRPDTSVISLSVSCDIMEDFLRPFGNKLGFLQNKDPIKVHLDIFEQQCIYTTALPTISSNEVTEAQCCKILLGMIISILLHKSTFSTKNEEVAVPASFSALLSNMMSPENIHDGIDALLSLSNFSHSHLCRIFKKYLDMSPHEYITSLRMKYAFDLVVSSDMTFEAIAETVGYSSFSHFCLKFKETYHKTLATVRKEYKAKTI